MAEPLHFPQFWRHLAVMVAENPVFRILMAVLEEWQLPEISASLVDMVAMGNLDLLL
ncbi:hypothetical protein SPRA44_610048 [Serratia proteamaculans]|nr:hypothetical protein SPRA44_610048 [Serratia proteamaculans]